MIKDTRRGAYRNYVAPEISGETTAVFNYNSKFISNGNILTSGRVGKENVVELSRRFIEEDELPLDIVIGDNNDIKAYFRSKLPYKEGNHNISIGDGNIIDMRTSENGIDIVVGDRNYINGSFNAGSIVIGDDNIVIDFDGIIEAGKKVSIVNKLGSLMFDTRISEYAGEGTTFLTVEDTSLMAYGGEIKFGTVGSAFARKKIVQIIENKVFIDSPLTAKEATYPNALVFNSLPEIMNDYMFNTSASATALSKRLPIDTDAVLALREIEIGEVFNTKIFFVRSSDNIAIVKDLLPQDFPTGTQVVAKGRNPYTDRSWAVSSIDVDNNIVVVDDLDGTHIGRILTDDNYNEYVIVGFFDSKIVLDRAVDSIAGHLYSDAIVVAPEVKNIETVTTNAVSADSVIIPIENTDGFYIDGTVYIEGYSEKRTIVAISSDSIEISMSMLPGEINNVACFGGYLFELNVDQRDNIEVARTNINTYLFGGN